MRLKLSQDQKRISIVTQDHEHREDDYDQEDSHSDRSECLNFGDDEMDFGRIKTGRGEKCNSLKIHAWDTENLQPVAIDKRLQIKLEEQEKGIIVNMFYVGKDNKYLLCIKQKHNHPTSTRYPKFKWLEYTIFDSQTGQI